MEKCKCGECPFLDFEDSCGNGWCKIKDVETNCECECVFTPKRTSIDCTINILEKYVSDADNEPIPQYVLDTAIKAAIGYLYYAYNKAKV